MNPTYTCDSLWDFKYNLAAPTIPDITILKIK